MASSLVDDVRNAARKAYGGVPNFLEDMNAHSGVPGAVYLAADNALMDGLLTPVEQQAVLLAVSAHHDSRYDGVIHARLALDAGLPPTMVERLLAGELPPDDRMQSLVEATRQTCEKGGLLDPDFVQHLAERGVSRGELYEIFALYGIKTLSSFVNHIADPEIDAALTPTEQTLENVPHKPSTLELNRPFMG